MAKLTRLTLRLEEDLYAAVVERAAVDHRSLNREIAYLLRQSLFPPVDADAYRNERQLLLSMPRHTIKPLGRPPKRGQ